MTLRCHRIPDGDIVEGRWLLVLLLLAFAPRRRWFDACPFTQGAKASTTAATASAEKIRCGLGDIVLAYVIGAVVQAKEERK